jgi:hypothetical protein
MKVKVESRDISKYLPKSKYNLDDKYDDLLRNCNEWDKIYFKNMFDSKSFKDIVNDETFKNICSIYNELKSENKQDSVTTFLLDLVNLNQYEFLIPYAYLTHTVPEEYHRAHLGMLGVSEDLPSMCEGI